MSFPRTGAQSSARHVGIIGLTEQAVVAPDSESNGTGILGEACGRSARGTLAAVTLPDYRGDFRSWRRTGRARCGGTIHAYDPTRKWGAARGRFPRSFLIALEVLANLNVGVFP